MAQEQNQPLTININNYNYGGRSPSPRSKPKHDIKITDDYEPSDDYMTHKNKDQK